MAVAEACPRCDGTGFEIVEQDGREFARSCPCRAPGGGAPVTLLDLCRIPARYEHCDFEHFTPGTAVLSDALQKTLRYASRFPHTSEEGLGLLFTGSNGVGKTHLAVAVLRDLADKKGVRGQFWDFHELMREIRASYNPDTRQSELEVLEPVVETDVLVLDDLGAWKMTDWMNDTLFYILNSRYLARRPSIITTNYQDTDLDKLRAADSLVRREYLVERIGQRLRSRLMEMCLVIPMEGQDQRRIRQMGLGKAL